MKPTPQQIRERNEAWARALEANPKKCVGQMRDGQGGRCCLAVAQDVALKMGMDAPMDFELPSTPWDEVADWFGWDSVNPYLETSSGEPMIAAQINDEADLPHAEIAKLVRETFCKEGAE